MRRAVLAALYKKGTEFPTEDALKEYLKEHPNADPKNHSVEKKDSAPSPEETKKETSSFLSKIKGVASSVKKALTEAPAQVQKIFTDPGTRKEMASAVAEHVKKSPEKVAEAIYDSAKKELKEVAHAAHAFKKLLSKPPEKWDKKDKAAVYSAASYVVGGVMAAAGGGPLMAAGAVGKSFAMHVGIKAVSEMADAGFLHYEWAETAAHFLHLAGEDAGESGSDEKFEKHLFEQLTVAASKAIESLEDKDMENILVKSDGPGADEIKQPKLAEKPKEETNKKARASLIRLASALPKGSPEKRAILKSLA